METTKRGRSQWSFRPSCRFCDFGLEDALLKSAGDKHSGIVHKNFQEGRIVLGGDGLQSLPVVGGVVIYVFA